MDPYEILGISTDADDNAVRKAYLELVRQCPPDTAPETFKKINNAYEKLKDEKSRLQYYLFNKETPADTPFQAFLQHVAFFEKRRPMSYENLKEFLWTCAKK